MHLADEFHLSYFRDDYTDSPHGIFNEEIDARSSTSIPADAPPSSGSNRSGTQLRTHRLAVSANRFYSAFHGGTVPLAQAAIVTAINRVTGIYEVEVSVRLQLVANNSALVFTGVGGSCPACDPFNNNSGDLDINQGVIDTVIGNANYDVGHVFTTASGGIAGLGVVGVSGQKARGTTGLAAPTGDLFFVDFVAHELGHQYGGSHTFNGTRGNCGANVSVSQINRVEPGSGSTIQSYAGICGLDDLQNAGQASSGDGTSASDPYFHSRSFDQIKTHVDLAVPGAGTSMATGNNVPTANAGPDVVVPAQTPFFLTATGSDVDAGDVLTYNYEQRDGGAAQRALDNPQVTSGPLFRSFPATTNATSYFPRLVDVASGNTNQNGACAALNGTARPPADCWAQFLPQVAGPPAVGNAVPLTFRATVRDNRAGGGGVNTDDTVVTVRNTGTPFKVTAPNGGGATLSGSTTVTWNVAGTTAAPVSAATVSIRLSIDGGLTYPIELGANTPNDGSQSVALPQITNGTARIMVHSGTYTGSGFFDISTPTSASSRVW